MALVKRLVQKIKRQPCQYPLLNGRGRRPGDGVGTEDGFFWKGAVLGNPVATEALPQRPDAGTLMAFPGTAVAKCRMRPTRTARRTGCKSARPWACPAGRRATG